MTVPLPLRRTALALYTLILITATHWPSLSFENAPIPRTDLWLHLFAFATLSTLAFASCLFQPTKNTPATLAVLLLFAAIDESTQAIPILHRHTSLLDFLADCTGIFLGLALSLGFHRLARR